jgi:predicted RNA-binding protein with TRAM domain
MIIKIGLHEKGIMSINGFTMIIMDVVHLTIMKTFHNYLIASLFSSTHLHGMKKAN